MARVRFLGISVPLFLFVLASAGCSGLMEAYREQTFPSSEMPIRCNFRCPDRPDAGRERGDFRLDNLVVIDLREERDVIGSMYSADGPFTLVCMEDASFERILEHSIARILEKRSIAVGRDRGVRLAAGVSLYVEILDAWVESTDAGFSGLKIPIGASVVFRAVLQDDASGITLWESEFRGENTEKVLYSFSRHHATSLGKAYCEAIRSFETAVGSAGFLGALRR